MIVTESADTASHAASRIAAEFADVVDREGRMPEEALAALRRGGLLSSLIPGSLGGQEQTLSEVAAVCHSLAEHNVHICCFQGSIAKPSQHHIDRPCRPPANSKSLGNLGEDIL